MREVDGFWRVTNELIPSFLLGITGNQRGLSPLVPAGKPLVPSLMSNPQT